MMRQFSVLLSLFPILWATASYAQTGNPFLTNYQLSKTIVDNQNRAMVQNSDETMLFANRQGILAFDGEEWNLIPTDQYPYTLERDPADGKIYVGCNEAFGYMKKDEKGYYNFQSLSSSLPNPGAITTIAIDDANVWFCSEDVVTRLSKTDSTDVKQWPCPEAQPYTGFVPFEGGLLVNIDKVGLHRLDKNRHTQLPNGDLLAENEIVFSFPYDNTHTLIGTDDNALYLYDGNQFGVLEIEAQDYLDESVLSGGIALSNSKIALATLTGGVLIIHKFTGKTIYTINYQTGLPDDEIYAMGQDNHGGLWISHEFGISRIDHALPVRRFDAYPGLVGNLTCVIDHQENLYVGTSEGLFFLDKVEDYKEIEVLIKRKRKPEDLVPAEANALNPGAASADSAAANPSKGDPEEKLSWKEKRKIKKEERKKKREERRRKKREKGLETVSNTEDSVAIVPDTPDSATTVGSPSNPANPANESETILVPEKVYALQSISHLFRRVEGFEGKCRQLIPHGNGLLLATNTGLYEMREGIAIPIVPDHYIWFIYPSRMEGRYYVGTSNGLLMIKAKAGGEWEVIESYDKVPTAIYSIVEDDANHLWLGSENIAYYAQIDGNGRPLTVRSYAFDNDYSEKVVVRKVYGQTFFFLSSGIFEYSEAEDKVLFSPKLNENFKPNSRYIFSQENVIWIFNTQEWISLYDHADLVPPQKIYLDLFEDIQNIYIDKKRNIWIVDKNNSLFKILSDAEQTDFPLNIYIRSVYDIEGQGLALSDLQMEYTDNNSLEIQVAAPYYVKVNSVEYQYQVEGLMKNWSRWNSNSRIDIPFIPSGDYTLRVRARNVLGKVSDEKILSFSVTPPFWESTWFIILCGVAGLLAIWLLIKIRERGLRRQRLALENKVNIRTVQLQEQKDKTEELLLNILPHKVAEELKSEGRALPRKYNFATVLFTDFKGFTTISESIPPEELVKELDSHFGVFDEIVAKWGVEKIKTIGDAYMCACGLPEQNENHPILTVLASMQIRDYMEYIRAKKSAESKQNWELRIGIHSGPVIAGVVGKNKFAYDIWGDTVNTAARMEESSEPGKINVSGATYKAIKPYFECSKRGKVEAKNKGMLDMYFVDGIKAEYSIDGLGEIPNDKFLKLLGIDPGTLLTSHREVIQN